MVSGGPNRWRSGWRRPVSDSVAAPTGLSLGGDAGRVRRGEGGKGKEGRRKRGRTFDPPDRSSVQTGFCKLYIARGQSPFVLYLELDEFMLELKDGSFKNVGPPTKRGTAKLYDVVDAAATEFGDERVKLSFEDEDGSEVQVALSPSQATDLVADVERIREEGIVFE